uniref:Uncharacterized protein n=1 Tax=Arundo donax TaxID=35708 RepID=A0A0A9EWV0_ARUDO
MDKQSCICHVSVEINTRTTIPFRHFLVQLLCCLVILSTSIIMHNVYSHLWQYIECKICCTNC